MQEQTWFSCTRTFTSNGNIWQPYCHRKLIFTHYSVATTAKAVYSRHYFDKAHKHARLQRQYTHSVDKAHRSKVSSAHVTQYTR